MNDVMSIINQQGAQVVALQQRCSEMAAIINLLASELKPGQRTYDRKRMEEADRLLVKWRVTKSGVTVKIGLAADETGD